jgi:pilus assembly protein CpaF
VTICEIKTDVEDLLQRLPGEIQLDLSEAAARFHQDHSVKKRVEELVRTHPARQRILDELFDCGPLAPLLQDEEITEILVNGHEAIWFEKDGRFFRHDDVFHSAFTLSQFVQMICLQSRLRLDLNLPFADGLWRGMRVHLAQFPLVHCSHTICLRRHPRQRWMLTKLMEQGWASDEQFGHALRLLQERRNFLIVGPTGSGKTSVLSALLGELPLSERSIVIEDTDEIKIANDVSTKLLTRPSTLNSLRSFDQADLVKQSLRMRPSRLIIGEVRGGEAKDLLLALSTGHSGSMGTLHASSARQALLRLEMLVQIGAPEWSLDTIRKLILLSLDYLVVVEIKDGKRRLEGIYKICSLEKIGFLLEKTA